MDSSIYRSVVIVMILCLSLANGQEYSEPSPCGCLEVPLSDSNRRDEFCRPHLTLPWELHKPRRCVCRPGLVRNAWGDCITEQECLRCKCFRDKDFNVCRRKCPVHCNQPIPASCSRKCYLGCDCPPGYVRGPETSNYRCTKTTECAPKCPPHSKFESCLSTCEPTCGIRQPSICVTRCQRGDCVCIDGYAKTELNGEIMCVPQKDCYRYARSTTLVNSPGLGQIGGAVNTEGNRHFSVAVPEQPRGSNLPVTVVSRPGGISVDTVAGSSSTSDGGVGGGIATGMETSSSPGFRPWGANLPRVTGSRPNGVVLNAVGLPVRSNRRHGDGGGRPSGTQSVGSPNFLQWRPYLTNAIERRPGAFPISTVGAPTASSSAQGGVGGSLPAGRVTSGSPDFRLWGQNLPGTVERKPGGAIVNTVGLSSRSSNGHHGVDGGIATGTRSVGSLNSQPRGPYLISAIGRRAGVGIVNTVGAPSVSSNGHGTLGVRATGRTGSLDSQEIDETGERINPDDIPSPYTAGSGGGNVVIASVGIPSSISGGTNRPAAAPGTVVGDSPAPATPGSVESETDKPSVGITGIGGSSSTTSILNVVAPFHNNAAYTSSPTSIDRMRTVRGNIGTHLVRVPSVGAAPVGRTTANAGTRTVHSPGSAIRASGAVGNNKEQLGIQGIGGYLLNIPEIPGAIPSHSMEGSKPGAMSLQAVGRQEQGSAGHGSAGSDLFSHGTPPIIRSLPGVTTLVGTESPETTMPVPAGPFYPVYGGVSRGAATTSISTFASRPPGGNAAESETGTTRARRIWVEAVPSTFKPGAPVYGGRRTGANTNSIDGYGNQPLGGNGAEITRPQALWVDVVPSHEYRRKAQLLGVSGY